MSTAIAAIGFSDYARWGSLRSTHPTIVSVMETNQTRDPSSMRGAIVTGASRGIGRAIALELSRLGFAVVVNYVHRADAAQKVVEEIQLAGGMALPVGGDVSRAKDRRKLIDAALDRFNRLDLLVNNAGIASPGRRDLLETDEESFHAVFATNLEGPFFLAQAAAREMIRQIRSGVIPAGKIINISSISAYAVSTNRGDYCMAKAAMSMMTGLFAQRLADEKIGVYEICPGVIASDMTAPVRDKYDRMIADGAWPIRRWGTPEDVARAVAAVALDYFPFSTGMRLDVDGGFHIRTL
jgi:3-oxoacyl-[acyl-carrier protein] reductase